MDPELKDAVISGDIQFLIQTIDSKPQDYFLSQFIPSDPADPVRGNIFHIAAWHGKVEFFKEAMKKLPNDVKLILLSQLENLHQSNPLHIAAWTVKNSYEMVKIILEFHKSIDQVYKKPWLVLNAGNNTPFYNAVYKPNVESALEILRGIDDDDKKFVCNVVSNDGNSTLFLAVKNGLSRVAELVLSMSSSYSLIAAGGSTPLHFAPNCSESVLKLLLEKHPNLLNEVDKKGFNVLHQWASIGKDWPLKIFLNGNFPEKKTKVFKDLIHMIENEWGDNPLHTAARSKSKNEFAQLLIQGYQEEIMVGESSFPWKTQNKDGNTPLHLALYSNLEELTLYLISVDPTLYHIYNGKGESPLFVAVIGGCGQVVEEILRTQDPRYDMLCRNDGQTVLHWLRNCSEETGRRLLEKFWWLMNLRDVKGITALDEAKQANVPWLVHLLRNPSSIKKEPFNWKIACEKNETLAVLAFVDTCHDLPEVCRKENDTPLHHVKLQNYKDYLDFLKNPSIVELKNTIDYEGATPLHRALEREDMFLAKALLLDNGVERNIQNYHGTTPIELLAKLCKENDDWAKMCKQIKVNPYLKTTYIQPKTNLDQMRGTLSVVAALLATITFAAGFTLPGGLNSETGSAMLGKNVSFIVFLLADAYAMCTSMLVLFCLIWSMISTPDMASLLIDRSVLILMQSLYGTMLAFMTGIYTVTAHTSLWAAIIIFFMCSFIIIITHRTVLHKLLAKLTPATNQDKDQSQLLEEGRAHTSGIVDSLKSK